MTTLAHQPPFVKKLKFTLASAAIIALFTGMTNTSWAMYVAPYIAKQQAGNTTGQLIQPSATEQLNLQLAAYDQFIEQNKDSTEQAKLLDVASVYFNKGKLLSESQRGAEAQAVFDTLIKQFKSYPPAEMQVAYAYLGRMLLQSARGEAKPALATADELIKRFGASANPAVKETVAKTYLAQSTIYIALAKLKQAVAANSQVIQRYSGEPAAAMKQLVAQAYVDQIVLQARLHRIKDALTTFDQALGFMGDAPELAQYRAYAYFNKGVAYRAVDDYPNAIQAYNQMLALFAEDKTADVQRLKASAYSNQAENLVKLERYSEAQQVVDEALTSFAAASDANMREAVATLYNNKGFLLFAQSKQLWPDNKTAALDKLQQAKLNYEQALAFKNIPGMSYGSLYENYAYTMYLLGDTLVARQYLAKALQAGAQTAYEAALEDINMHTISEDAGFKSLLIQLWSERQQQK